MSQKSNESKKEINWFAIAGTLFAILSGVALFLGYGVTLAVESVFGMPHAAVFESSTELLDLSSIALIDIIPSVTKFITDPQRYFLLYKENATSLLTLSGVAFLVVLVLGWMKFGKDSEWVTRFNPFRQKPESNENTASKKRILGFIGFSIASIASPFLVPLIGVIFVVGILYFSAFIVLIPFIGMNSGVAYIEKWVLEPQACTPVRSTADILNNLKYRSTKKTEKTQDATEPMKTVVCAVVKKEGKEIARGRVVLQTSKSLLLLASDGIIRRVPTSDMVIELVGDISAPAAKPVSAKK